MEERERVINHCSRQILLNEAIEKFDSKSRATETEPCRRTLRASTENVVSVPTTSEGLGLLPKNELVPGVFIDSTLTRAVKSFCVTSVVKTMETDQNIELTCVVLEGLDGSESALALTFTAVAGSDNKLSILRNQLRLDHLNSE